MTRALSSVQGEGERTDWLSDACCAGAACWADCCLGSNKDVRILWTRPGGNASCRLASHDSKKSPLAVRKPGLDLSCRTTHGIHKSGLQPCCRLGDMQS